MDRNFWVISPSSSIDTYDESSRNNMDETIRTNNMTSTDETVALLRSMKEQPQAPQHQSSRSSRRPRSPKPDWQMGVPQSDPTHPLNGLPRSNRPPRGALIPPPSPPPQASNNAYTFALGGNSIGHRRAKSDMPTPPPMMSSKGGGGGGGGASVSGGSVRSLITKTELVQNLPDPRWGGALPTHTRNRSRTGSDSSLIPSHVHFADAGGYGATDPSTLQSIGSVKLSGRHHRRTTSDASASVASMDGSVVSVTTDLAKSSLFRGVTNTGRIRLQLPKDSFRILMDGQLEAGQVYKRKLVDSEDDLFVEFYTLDEDYNLISYENQKRLPPDLYVMAVDNTIYKRILDEVIASRSMPCGIYYCGHHADVRHPDITIAVLIVSAVVILLLAGSIVFGDS
jgi:hypothetical protein